MARHSADGRATQRYMIFDCASRARLLRKRVEPISHNPFKAAAIAKSILKCVVVGEFEKWHDTREVLVKLRGLYFNPDKYLMLL
jgi:hypothetical protein